MRHFFFAQHCSLCTMLVFPGAADLRSHHLLLTFLVQLGIFSVDATLCAYGHATEHRGLCIRYNQMVCKRWHHDIRRTALSTKSYRSVSGVLTWLLITECVSQVASLIPYVSVLQNQTCPRLAVRTIARACYQCLQYTLPRRTPTPNVRFDLKDNIPGISSY